MATMQSHLAGAERAFALLDESPDVAERPNARPLVRTSGAMAFRNVSFAYETDRSVLHDISFEITPGTCLGIAGATGAGKTTLVNLLTRFYDPSAGQILEVNREPGELIELNDRQPVIVMADTSRLRVRAYVEELDVEVIGENRQQLAVRGRSGTAR